MLSLDITGIVAALVVDISFALIIAKLLDAYDKPTRARVVLYCVTLTVALVIIGLLAVVVRGQ